MNKELWPGDFVGEGQTEGYGAYLFRKSCSSDYMSGEGRGEGQHSGYCSGFKNEGSTAGEGNYDGYGSCYSNPYVVELYKDHGFGYGSGTSGSTVSTGNSDINALYQKAHGCYESGTIEGYGEGVSIA